jgi:putative component of toxin-antitoxin plasmid stabilization module
MRKKEYDKMGQNEFSNDEWWVVLCCCGDQSSREAEQEKRENDIQQIDIK